VPGATSDDPLPAAISARSAKPNTALSFLWASQFSDASSPGNNFCKWMGAEAEFGVMFRPDGRIRHVGLQWLDNEPDVTRPFAGEPD